MLHSLVSPIFRFITAEVTREISVLFHREITGPWITFSEYPQSELDTLYARFQEIDFKCNHSGELHRRAFKLVVSSNYSTWMYRLRNPIFKKYATQEERAKHPPKEIAEPVWRLMVEKWSQPDWQVSRHVTPLFL